MVSMCLCRSLATVRLLLLLTRLGRTNAAQCDRLEDGNSAFWRCGLISPDDDSESLPLKLALEFTGQIDEQYICELLRLPFPLVEKRLKERCSIQSNLE